MRQFITQQGKTIGVEIKAKTGRVYYSARYHQEEDYMYANWQGMVTVEEVITGAKAFLELLEKNPCAYLLNDNSKLTGTWDKANDWIASEWMPRALALGLKKFAHVVSPSIFGELSAKNMETRVEQPGFSMRTFNSREEAFAWLTQQQLATS